MPVPARRSAVVVPVREASNLVDRWRERTCEVKPSFAVPPHVTLLFPFMAPGLIDDRIIASLREALASFGSFPFRFEKTGRFPGTLYLAPDPAEPFLQMTAALASAFPEFPPYGGAFEAILPHLTVAQGEGAVLDEAEGEMRRALPLRASAREALVIGESDANRRWRTVARLPLGETEAGTPA